MAITLRTVKGSALSHAELDANFTDITSSMVHSGSISGTTLTLHRSSSNFDIDLSGLDTTVATGSLLVTGSISNNVLTFTKGDGSTFNLTVDTGSLLVTGSVSNNVLTFDKGDGTSFSLTVDTGSGGGGGTTLYTGDGTITGTRLVSGSSSNLTFGGFNLMTLDSQALTINAPEVVMPGVGEQSMANYDVLIRNQSSNQVHITGSDVFGGGTPGGSDTQVQFNDGGSFGGESTFTYDKTNNTLTVQSAGTGTNRATPAVELRASDVGLTDNDVIGQIQAAHYLDDTKNAGLVFAADANWNAQGTFDSKIEFRVTSGTTEFLHTTMKSNGRMGIGVAAPTNGFLEVNGDVSGTSIYASANIVAYSDARSKTNVTTIDNALDKVDAIRGVTYNKVEDPDGIRYMGVIAQELQEVLPEVVAEGEDGRLAVAYGNIVGVLIEAVKELKAEIAELKANR